MGVFQITSNSKTQFSIINVEDGRPCYTYPSTTQIKNDIIEDEAYKKMLVQIKFFNGDLNYTDEQLDYLKEWVGDKKAEFKNFFLTEIIHAFPEKCKLLEKTRFGELLEY